MAGRRLLLESVVVALLFVVLTFCIVQPLLSNPAGALFDARTVAPGAQGSGFLKDVMLLAWIYAWGWRAIVHDPGGFFDGNAFYPYPMSMGFSEHSLGKLPTAGLAFGLTGNAVLAHQVDLVLSFALSGASLFAYLRYARVGIVAAVLAGATFAFAPYRLETIYHTHLLAWQYLPLALLFLHRTLQHAGIASAAAFGAMMLLQCLCSYYLAYMSLICVVVFGLALVFTARETVSARGVIYAGAAAGMALGVFALMSMPYLQLRALGVVPRYDSESMGGAMVLHYASSDPWRSYLDPWWGLHHPGRPGAFLGWLASAVALVGCLALRRSADRTRRSLVVAAMAITVVAWALSLGPVVEIAGLEVPAPYAFLSRVIPGFSSMRAPARFALPMLLGFATLVGFGLDAVGEVLSRQRSGRRIAWAAAGVFAVVTAVEYRLPSRTFAAYAVFPAGSAPAVEAELAKLPRGVVAEFPFQGERGIDASRAMLFSTVHWRPLVNGKSGYEPRGRNAIIAVAEALPKNPSMLQAFVRLTGVRYIVVRVRELPADEVSAWRQMPGVRWLPTGGDGDLLGTVVLKDKADLKPVLLACAGYRSGNGGGRDEACAELERQVRHARRLAAGARAARAMDQPRP